MSRITQRAVVRTAVEQLSKRGGYTADTYFSTTSARYLSRPGDSVGVTCAIGGVEQAIWKLTGENVGAHVRFRLAQTAVPELEGDETPRQRLYAGVMRKLNAKARDLFPVLEGELIDTVEEVTFAGSHRTSRRRTLQVFNAVLADLEPKS